MKCPICEFNADNNLLMEEHVWFCHRISIVGVFEKWLEDMAASASFCHSELIHAEAVELAMSRCDWEQAVATAWGLKKIREIGT